MILPFVSVIIPMLNEESYITQCLGSLLRQDYPPGSYEILVVDGGSADASRALVTQMRALHPQIQLLVNPEKGTARSLNLGIRQAGGELIVRMDAHALAPPSYISSCAKYLLQDNADNIGGVIETKGRGYWGQSIALGISCSFGVGNSKFRCSRVAGYDEAGWPGAFKKQTLLALGGYNEVIGCNEDDELNYRLLRSGGKVFRTPEIALTYFCRDSLKKLATQYFHYGFWKVRVIQLYGKFTSIRHVIPAVYVGSLLLAVCLSFFFSPFVYLLLLALAAHLIVSAAYAIKLSWGANWLYLFSLPVVFATLHLSYGAGFLCGLIKFLPGAGTKRSQDSLPGRAKV